MSIAVLAALGLAAGTLTTIAGQGGGLMLLLACSALVGPHEALALTAPALLLGNLHRAFLFRHDLDWSVALRMVPAALVGALVGGLLAGIAPSWLLRAVLVLLTVLAIAKAVRLVRFEVPRKALGPVGFALGAMTGTSGGAGIMVSPILLSLGLTGRVFVATTSAIAVAMHVGRVAGYATLGLFSRELVLPIALLSAAIFGGNAIGTRAKAALGRARSAPSGGRTGAPGVRVVTADVENPRAVSLESVLEYGTLIVCVVLSVAGIG